MAGANQYHRGWRTDISEFFASVSLDAVGGSLQDIAHPRTVQTIAAILTATSACLSRTGLPQRSSASSLLANLLLVPVAEAGESLGCDARFVRWLEDIWVFSRSDT